LPHPEAPGPRRARRVWLVNHYASAPDQAAGSRHYELARRLVDRGYSVTIFAASFAHRSGRDRRLPAGRLYRQQSYDGVRFVWMRTVPYHGNTWRRQLNMVSFLIAFLVVQTRFSAPDVIIGSTVHPFAALGAWIAARLRRAWFMFEIRDLWPQTLVDLGALRMGSPGERLLRRLEAFLVRRASTVITLLPGIRDYLLEQGLPAGHVAYIPNGADLAAFGSTAPGAPASESEAAALSAIALLRDEGRFVLGYLGAFGRVNRTDLIVDAVAEAERRAPGRIGAVLIGAGPERPAVEQQAASVPAVRVIHSVPKTSVPRVLQALDAAVVHTTYTPVYRYGISFNKLFEYMAAGRPVVFACDSAYDPVAATGSGVSIPPDDPQRLAAAFLELADLSPEARAAMGSAGRAYVASEHNFDRLATTLEALVEGSPHR